MKRKTKLKQVIILLLLVFMCAFALSNYKNYKLLKNGYSINEVKEINKNLISDDIKSLIKRNYTKDVIRIIESKKFKPTNFNNYLKLLDELGNYNDKIIDIVNEKYYKRTLSKRYINYYKNNPLWTVSPRGCFFTEMTAVLHLFLQICFPMVKALTY